MSDAIERAVSSPPRWDEVGTAPALTGLRRRSLAPLDVLAPSLAAAKPAATALVLPVLLTAYVGPGAWLSVVIAVAGALLLCSVIEQFTSRMVTSGSLYTFVVTGLGPWAGVVTATAMVVGYSFAAGYALTSTGLAGRALVAHQMGATPTFDLFDAGAVLLIGLGCGQVLVRRVTAFTAVTLLIQVVTVVAVGYLLVLVGPQVGGTDLFSLAGADPVRVTGGAAVVLALLVGFECSASLGAEAARPFRSVPRSMRVAVLVTGGLSLLTTLLLGGDSGPLLDALRHSVRIEHLWFPDGGFGLTLFRVTRILSLLACALAVWAAMTRLVFTLALEGLLPRRLAETHPRYATPYQAVRWTGPLVIVPGVLLLLGDHGLQSVIASLLDTSGLVMMVAYLLVCVAAPSFLNRLGELTGRSVAAAVLAVLVLAGAIVCSIAWQESRGDAAYSRLVALSVVPVATCWYAALRRLRPDALRRAGLHDGTIAADTWRAGDPGPGA